MKPKTVLDLIEHLDPCDEARDWAREQTQPTKAWRECQRGDWMLWLLDRLSGEPESASRKRLVLCSCECARLALPYTKDLRVPVCIETCIETAERWARGEASIEQVREARIAAYNATNSICKVFAPHHASAAAAYAADTAFSSDAAAYVVSSAANAAYAANAFTATARLNALAQCADIVRKREHYPRPPRIILNH